MAVENPNEGLTVKKKVEIPVGRGNQTDSGESSLISDYLKLRREKKVEQLIEKEMGPTEKGKVSTGTGEEGLAATIVKAALATNQEATKLYKDLADSNDKRADKALETADKIKTEMNTIIAGQIGGALERLEKIQQEIKTSNQPKPLLEQLGDIKAIGAMLNPQPVAPASSGGDSQVEIALAQMKLNHEAAMKKLDLEMERMKADLQIRLAEFTSNREDKKREYEDSRKFRENAFTTVNDIVAAASAGFANKVGPPAGVASEVKATGETDPATQKSRIVPGFECKDCGMTISVPDGATEVTCPNEQCGAQYAIRP